MKSILLAAMVLVVQGNAPPTPKYTPPVVCKSDMDLGYALTTLFHRIQTDALPSLPWRIFLVVREFQNSGFVVTKPIRSAVCEGGRWIYGDSPDDFTVPKSFAPLAAPLFDTVG